MAPLPPPLNPLMPLCEKHAQPELSWRVDIECVQAVAADLRSRSYDFGGGLDFFGQGQISKAKTSLLQGQGQGHKMWP